MSCSVLRSLPSKQIVPELLHFTSVQFGFSCAALTPAWLTGESRWCFSVHKQGNLDYTCFKGHTVDELNVSCRVWNVLGEHSCMCCVLYSKRRFPQIWDTKQQYYNRFFTSTINPWNSTPFSDLALGGSHPLNESLLNHFQLINSLFWTRIQKYCM